MVYTEESCQGGKNYSSLPNQHETDKKQAQKSVSNWEKRQKELVCLGNLELVAKLVTKPMSWGPFKLSSC